VQVEQSDDGGFLVAWMHGWNPTFGGFRRLNPNGGPATEPRRMTVPPKDVAASPGGFWVAGGQRWDTEVLLQRYDSDGESVTPPFQVADTGLSPYGVNIATSEDGRFMVVWYEESCSTLETPCYSDGGWARSFDANGDPLSDTFELEINSDETQTEVVSIGPDAFVVSASDYYHHGPTIGLAIDSVGEPLGASFPFDDVQTVERLSSGDLIAAWAPRAFPSDSLFVRRYSPSGEPRSPIVEVASCESGSECFFRRLFALEPGLYDDFLVVWQEELQSSDDIYARWYGPTMNGSAPTLVAEPEYRADAPPAVQLGLDGSFLVVWGDPGSEGVFGRFVTTPVTFADGFESGDTSFWSVTVP